MILVAVTGTITCGPLTIQSDPAAQTMASKISAPAKVFYDTFLCE